jgi:hypothetical protein
LFLFEKGDALLLRCDAKKKKKKKKKITREKKEHMHASKQTIQIEFYCIDKYQIQQNKSNNNELTFDEELRIGC